MNAIARYVTKRTRTLEQQGSAAKLHVRAWAQARKALQKLEVVRGRTDPKVIQAGNDYAADVLGWKGYAPWLHVYSAVQGGFREGWLPDNYYASVIVPKVNGEYRRLSRLRSCNRILFNSDAFPDLGYSVNGIFYDADFKPVAWDRVGDFLRDRAQAVVFKADASSLGLGVRFIDTAARDTEALRRLGNGVVQSRVVQHPFFDKFMPSSVATVRFATVIDDGGQPSVRACYVRFGRSKDSHVRADDQVRIAVDPSDGRLSGEGFLSDWTPVDRHPDSGQGFEGQVIPHLDRCVATVLDLHARSPQARCVSWDLVVDAEGEARVLEWENGVVSFAEATQGPCFTDLGWDRLHRT